MSLIRLFAAVSLSLSSLFCLAQVSPARTDQAFNIPLPQDVRLIRSGVRASSNGPRLPLWAIMVGNTERAEQVAHGFAWLGPCGLNATLWTRTGDSDAWVRTTFRRPQSVDEALDWHENTEAFVSRHGGDESLLPKPFSSLTPELLEKLDFIIAYDDGSAKAYLYPGTTTSDAREITSAVTSQAQ